MQYLLFCVIEAIHKKLLALWKEDASLCDRKLFEAHFDYG